MIATTTLLSNNFPKWIVSSFFQTFEEGSKLACKILWNFLILFLRQNWLTVLIFIFIIVIISTIKAFSGYWGILGSVLYNIFYFGILFTLGLIFGPEIFVSNWYEPFCIIILYPFCYFIVGVILRKFGFIK